MSERCEKCGGELTIEDPQTSPLGQTVCIVIVPRSDYVETLTRCKPCGWFRYEYKPKEGTPVAS